MNNSSDVQELKAVQPTRTNQYLFAIALSGCFVVALSAIGIREYQDSHNTRPFYLLAVLLPFLIFFLVKLTRSRGPTKMRLRLGAPAYPGTPLTGEIILDEERAPLLPMRVELCCYRFRRIGLFWWLKIRPGRSLVRGVMYSTLLDSSITWHKVRSDVITATPGDWARSDGGYRLQLRFDLPSDAPESSETPAGEIHMWILHCQCEDAGLFEFADCFFGGVPVRRN